MRDRRMVVVDLDGTLLNIKQVCSPKTKKYLKKLKELGYIIVIATGRFLRSAVNITDGAEFANYIIANSGGLIYDIDNYKSIKKHNIDLSLVRSICDDCDYNEIDYINICDFLYNNRYMNSYDFNKNTDRKINNLNKFFDEVDDVFSVTIQTRDNSFIKKYYKKFQDDNLDVLIMQDSYSDEQSLEVFAKGVSKYNAIRELCELENIKNENVIAFGDGLNDVDMIKFVGTGVAMGNALKEVKKVSDYVTISHNKEGVIHFLDGYFNEDNLLI